MWSGASNPWAGGARATSRSAASHAAASKAPGYSGTVSDGCACMIDEAFLAALAAAEGGCSGGISYEVRSEGEGCRRYICCRGTCYSAGARDTRCEPPIGGELDLSDAGGVASLLGSALEDPEAKCRIEIGARHFGVWGELESVGKGVHHLFVILTDSDGKKYAIHGAPGGHQSEVCGGYDFGCIRIHFEDEDGITFRVSDLPPVTVAEGAEACAAFMCLSRVAAEIVDASIAYELMGPNSNSVAHSLISSCGLHFTYPEWAVPPGWKMIIP